MSALSGSRIADGVREKRGAGAGCVTPSTSTKVLRATLCGWLGASARLSTGAKQTSVPSMIAHHSSRVLVLITAASLAFSAGQAVAVHLGLERRVVEAGLLQQQGVELRLDRAQRDPAPAGALVGVVELRAAVEQVRAALVGPDA